MAKKKTTKSIPELDMALEVSNSTELEDIALIESRCKLFPVPQDGNGGYDYDISASTDYNVEQENNSLLVKVRLKFKAKNKHVNDVVLLVAEYIAVYNFKTEKDFSAEQYTRFTDYCSVFHVWPYWREFVQRSIASLRMPPLTLPPFKFGTKLPNEESLISKNQIVQKKKMVHRKVTVKKKNTTK